MIVGQVVVTSIVFELPLVPPDLAVVVPIRWIYPRELAMQKVDSLLRKPKPRLNFRHAQTDVLRGLVPLLLVDSVEQAKHEDA